ncbi:unnamed protein product [Periconia digitata]|uniref:Alpha/beta hydrolase fold-3 domain-containing protein n=1 Tax=Periconia digitata TaxID=1303443 RepID=A0A9W4XSZ5_9PLEO|nr:unnamed protein product [Periconia digitata]
MGLLQFLVSFPQALVHVPFSLLRYILSPRFRPDKTWTFAQAAKVRFLRAVIHLFSALQLRTPTPLDAGAEGDAWVRIRFQDEWRTYLKGDLLTGEKEGVKAGDVGGTWYTQPTSSITPKPSPSSNDDSNLTILHFHGGAFVLGDGRAKATAFLAQTLLAPFPASTRLLAPQYRLSTLPASADSNPFPAALQDALASYLHLILDCGIPPANVILSGDSAGGNLAIALLRYLSDYGADLGLRGPGAALLWSPWIDPSLVSPSILLANPNFASDILPPPFVVWGSEAYCSPPSSSSALPKPRENPYINAKISGFNTDTPLFVNVGGREVLCDDGTEWVDAMSRVTGNRVTLDVEAKAPHDVLLLGDQLGFEDVAARQCARAEKWVGAVRDGK